MNGCVSDVVRVMWVMVCVVVYEMLSVKLCEMLCVVCDGVSGGEGSGKVKCLF